MSPAMTRSKQWDIRRAIALASVFHFIHSAAKACLIPFLTLYFRQLGLTASMTGIVMGTKHLLSLVWSPISGLLAKHYNKRRGVILASLLGSVAASLLLLLIPPSNDEVMSRYCNISLWGGAADPEIIEDSNRYVNFGNVTPTLGTFTTLGYQTTSTFPINETSASVSGTNSVVHTTRGVTGVELPLPAGTSVGVLSGANQTSDQATDHLNEPKQSVTSVTQQPTAKKADAQEGDSVDERRVSAGGTSIHTPSKRKARSVLNAELEKDASSEFLGNLNVMDAQHQLFFLVLMVVALWEFLAAPLEQTADDGLYEYLDFVDATDRYGKHRVWALLGAAGSVGCIGLLVSSLNCFISGHTPRSAVHFYTHALLIAAAILVAAFLPLYSSRKREPLNQVVRALQLVSAEGRAMLCATTAFLVGAAGAGVDNFLFWEMQDKGSSELFMGSSLAIALLSQFAMSFFSNRVSKVLGQMGTVVFGTVCLALQCLYYSFLWSPWAVLPVQVLSSFSGGALWVALRTQCDDISTPGMERAVQRVFHGLSLGLGAGLGSFAGGFVTQRFGVELLFRATAAALLLWSVGFLIAQSRMPRQKRLNYSRLLVADTSEVSDSESEQERDWLVSAMKDDKCNNIR
ncbi:major facilitator superfamily domain-containing protein 6-like [Amia ocellicauda]|uniref:major facilitator superfamily domain-containing protein 6-like n=1 Tax=Amia ocellicauda TaxID=2972642 RepID=UPI00346461F1